MQQENEERTTHSKRSHDNHLQSWQWCVFCGQTKMVHFLAPGEWCARPRGSSPVPSVGVQNVLVQLMPGEEGTGLPLPQFPTKK